MVKVYYETRSPDAAELVAVFADEDTYNLCLPILEKDAIDNNWEVVTESVEEETDLNDLQTPNSETI